MADRIQTGQKQAPVWTLFGIGGLSLLLRLSVSAVDGFRPQPYEYESLARSVLAGNGFVYHHLNIDYYSFAAPLYSWICAGIYLLTSGSVAAVILLQALVSSCHAVLVARLAERVFNRQAGLLAGILMAVHPGLVVYASLKLHPLTFDAFFFTFAIWTFIRLRDRPTIGRASMTGLAVGVATLSRATAIIVLPLGSMWLLATSSRRECVILAMRCLLVAAAASVIATPWTIRNITTHRQFVFIQTTDAELLWRGNNPNATGHSYVDTDRLVLETLPAPARAELRSLPTEIGQSRWFRERAVAFIQADPVRFVRLTLGKFFHFWWFAPQTGMLYPMHWLRGYQIYYVPVMVLSLIGIGTCMWQGQMDARHVCVLIVLFVIVLSGLQSLYYVEGRHRWAVEPLLLVFSGGGAASMLTELRRVGRGQWQVQSI